MIFSCKTNYKLLQMFQSFQDNIIDGESFGRQIDCLNTFCTFFLPVSSYLDGG